MKTYSISQLLKLAKIRAKGCSKAIDDVHTSEQLMFEQSAELFFFSWLAKMEAANKIDFLLQQDEKAY